MPININKLNQEKCRGLPREESRTEVDLWSIQPAAWSQYFENTLTIFRKYFENTLTIFRKYFENTLPLEYFKSFLQYYSLSRAEVKVDGGKIPVDVPDSNKRPDTIANIIGTMAEIKDGEFVQTLTTGSST